MIDDSQNDQLELTVSTQKLGWKICIGSKDIGQNIQKYGGLVWQAHFGQYLLFQYTFLKTYFCIETRSSSHLFWVPWTLFPMSRMTLNCKGVKNQIFYFWGCFITPRYNLISNLKFWFLKSMTHSVLLLYMIEVLFFHLFAPSDIFNS